MVQTSCKHGLLRHISDIQSDPKSYRQATKTLLAFWLNRFYIIAEHVASFGKKPTTSCPVSEFNMPIMNHLSSAVSEC